MIYFDWLMRHQDRRSRLGDLARYAAANRWFPQSPASLTELVDHLTNRQAPGNIIRGAKVSWASWQRVMREQKAATALAWAREVRRLLGKE
jgi:hypothetical protein